ncbi:MAG: GNAT family N-acetyltransferase [Flavobacteriaceae bacterium]|nr:GNAT family N-acetyltransferase [Flavobacteriaceae bacterium]
MISYITRKDLDVNKYDTCIAEAINSKIYGYSWYLDIVTDNWDVLVLDDYKAVMPLPWRKKYFVKYVYPPLWVLELGVFYTSDSSDQNIFLREACKRFKFIELRMNTGNSVNDTIAMQPRQFQYLPLNISYETLKSNYRRDRQKDLKRASDTNLAERWNDNHEHLIRLFKANVGERIPAITEKDYEVLSNLIKTCNDKKLGEVVSIFDNNNLAASAFLLKYRETITILVSSTDFNNRKNGANTFLIDRILFKYIEGYSKFDFGGSSIPTIANYFKSFGASDENYAFMKHNNLPTLLRWLKP